MRPKMSRKARETKMEQCQTTRMASVVSSVVMNMTKVTATPAAQVKLHSAPKVHDRSFKG